MSSAAIFVAVVSFFFADGQVVSAEGMSFDTYEACIIQAEHDAKIMAHEIDHIESGLDEPTLMEVRITCEPMASHNDHEGYVPREIAKR